MRALYNGHPYDVVDIIPNGAGDTALLRPWDSLALMEVATDDPKLDLDVTDLEERRELQ